MTPLAFRLLTSGALALTVFAALSCAGREALTTAQSSPAQDTGLAGQIAQAAPPGDPPFARLAGLPPLPVDNPVDAAAIRARRASAVGETNLFGDQVFLIDQNSAALDPESHSCELNPGPGTLSWAMYAFTGLLPEDLPLVVSLSPLGELPPNPCYIAASNYARGRWEWTALEAGQQQYNVPVAAGAGALSPNGSLYIIVATFDAVPFGIGGLNLQLDCPAPPPEGFSAEPGDGVSVPVHLSWTDPAISFDPDGDGPLQFAYDGILIQRANSPSGPWTDILPVIQPGTTQFDDQASLGGNPPPESGYYYHLMTLVSGVTPIYGLSRFGSVDFAIILLEAKLTLAPLTGDPGVNVTLDGGSSSYLGGTFKAVKWDFEGDGKFDLDTSPTLITTHVYPSAGRYYPRLMLVMDLGGGATRTDTVTGYLAVGDKRGDWSQIGRNAQHTRCSPMRGPKTAHVSGSYDAGSTVLDPSIGADGKIYATTATGKLVVLNPDCTLDREVDLVSGIGASTPAMDKSGNMWLNIKSGGIDQLGCVFADFSVHSYPPIRASGKPVVTNDGTYLLDAIYNYVYLATPTPAGGDPDWWHSRYKWDDSTSTYSYTPTISRDGYIYVLGTNTSFKLTAGMLKLWASSGIPYASEEPAVSNLGFIYSIGNLPDNNDINGATSDGSWAYKGMLDTGQLAVGSVALAPDGNVYATTKGGKVYAFLPKLGAPLAKYTLAGDGFASAPVIDADGRIYALTISGKVVCLSKKLGFKWSYNLGSPAVQCELAIGNDGTLYVGGTNKLVAFN